MYYIYIYIIFICIVHSLYGNKTFNYIKYIKYIKFQIMRVGVSVFFFYSRADTIERSKNT